MKKSKMTIDDLAGMVQTGFGAVDKRFDGVDKRFDKIEDWQRLANGRFDAIEMELIDIKKKLETVVDRHEFEILRERVARLESILAHKKK